MFGVDLARCPSSLYKVETVRSHDTVVDGSGTGLRRTSVVRSADAQSCQQRTNRCCCLFFLSLCFLPFHLHLRPNNAHIGAEVIHKSEQLQETHKAARLHSEPIRCWFLVRGKESHRCTPRVGTPRVKLTCMLSGGFFLSSPNICNRLLKSLSTVSINLLTRAIA